MIVTVSGFADGLPGNSKLLFHFCPLVNIVPTFGIGTCSAYLNSCFPLDKLQRSFDNLFTNLLLFAPPVRRIFLTPTRKSVSLHLNPTIQRMWHPCARRSPVKRLKWCKNHLAIYWADMDAQQLLLK